MESKRMDVEPVWFKYATFGEDGLVNGIAEDAPEYAKEAYLEEQREKEEYTKRGEPIPK